MACEHPGCSPANAKLVDQGKLDLDAPVVMYVPELRLGDPRIAKTVTLRQLLSHSSGLVRDDRWVTRVPASRAQVIRDMATIKTTVAPGEQFQYCNQNFVLAGYPLERVTGQSWEAYTREHILVPLGIDSAAFSTADMEAAPDFARPYLPDVLRGQVSVPLTSGPYRALGALGPAGSIDASVVDMARYAQFQLGDGTFQGRRIVSARMLAEMHRPHIALLTSPEGRTIHTLSLADVTNYGLGWFLEDYRGAHLAEHGGAFVGFTANVTLIPSGQDGVVILTNADSAGAFVEAVRLSLVEWLLDMTPRRDVATELDTRSRLVLGVDPGRYNTLATAARAYQGSPAALHQWIGEYTGPGTKATITAAADALLVRGVSDELGAVDAHTHPANGLAAGGDHLIVNPGSVGVPVFCRAWWNVWWRRPTASQAVRDYTGPVLQNAGNVCGSAYRGSACAPAPWQQ